MVCFFGKRTNFLPSPRVARNVWGSKPRLFLAATPGIVPLRSIGNVGSTGAWRAVLLLSGGGLDRRAGDIDTSICLDRHLLTSAKTTTPLFYRFPGQPDSLSIRWPQPTMHWMVPNRQS